MVTISSRKGVKTLNAINSLAFILVLVGALNWGLVGLFNFDLVQTIFGGMGIANIVYGLVGVSAVIVGLKHFKK